jgi:hypothetical protein
MEVKSVENEVALGRGAGRWLRQEYQRFTQPRASVEGGTQVAQAESDVAYRWGNGGSSFGSSTGPTFPPPPSRPAL